MLKQIYEVIISILFIISINSYFNFNIIMVYLAILVAATVGIANVNALKDLPARARGGLAFKKTGGDALRSTNASAPQYWDSKCDHFNDADTCIFKQKYYVDEQYWDGKGPVFLEIGGEGDLSPPGGYIMTLAEQHNGLVVALEHRFYGESIPNNSAETGNYMAYLKVKQALADLNTFTEYFKAEKAGADAKWFAIGGSYPGALASWYRTAYPDATFGSLSSSGVVNCIIDYTDFDKAVTAAVGPECAQQIRNINSAYERMIDNDTSAVSKGWAEALAQFDCEPDMWYEDFFYMIADSWSMADQYGAKTDLCDTILAVGADATDDVLTSTFSEFSNSYWGRDFCSGGFYNTNQLADPDRWDVNSRSWRFQTCAEVSYFNTAPAHGSLRNKAVNMEYHLKQCKAVFGVDMWPSSKAINAAYGADEPLANHVFYSDFSDDPWQRASVDYSVSETQPYFLSMCTDCGHCKDLHAPSESDPEPVKQSRTEFEKHFAQWMSEA